MIKTRNTDDLDSFMDEWLNTENYLNKFEDIFLDYFSEEISNIHKRARNGDIQLTEEEFRSEQEKFRELRKCFWNSIAPYIKNLSKVIKNTAYMPVEFIFFRDIFSELSSVINTFDVMQNNGSNYFDYGDLYKIFFINSVSQFELLKKAYEDRVGYILSMQKGINSKEKMEIEVKDHIYQFIKVHGNSKANRTKVGNFTYSYYYIEDETIKIEVNSDEINDFFKKHKVILKTIKSARNIYEHMLNPSQAFGVLESLGMDLKGKSTWYEWENVYSSNYG